MIKAETYPEVYSMNEEAEESSLTEKAPTRIKK